MVQTSSSSKNLWVAASDGDLDRIRYLIETQDLSPNAKDSNSYTPIHAAASYSHLDLLTYLLSVGGDINVPDDDCETPLFTVESVGTARWLIDHGADPGIRNHEGMTAAEYLEEDHPEVSAYLSSLSSASRETNGNSISPLPDGHPLSTGMAVSALAVDEYANRQTSSLLTETRRIMEESQRDGTDPDERLREVVERAVRDGFSFGGQVGDAVRVDEDVNWDGDGDERKRTRENGNQTSGV